MKLYLTKHRNGTTQEITDLAASWTWSGDKASICRQLDLEIAFLEGSDLPVPEIGDLVTMVGDGSRLFAGVVLRRTAGSEDTILSATCFDYGIYLQKNDCTAKFTGATPEEITWSLCGEKGIPVASLPTTGISLRRKFSSVKINQAIVTVWSLAAEKNGTQYAIRYTPEGLLVKERAVSAASLVLKAAGNLMDASTTEDATNMVNSVAIYDKNGDFLRLLGDAVSQELVGVMETHVTQNDHSDTINQAKRLLEDGKQQRTVTVHVLGDLSLITGETVVVREHKTGLEGIFWIDADVHTWKNHNYDTMLTLNCRNVAATASAGSEIE